MSRRKEKMGRAANGNGTIRKKTVTRNGKEYTYWEARYTEGIDPRTGKQKQRSITGKTKSEVAEKLRKVTAEMDAGTYTAPSKMTLGQWLDIWQGSYIEDVKASTKHLYMRTVSLYILPALGAVKLDALTPVMVQNFYNSLLNPEKGSGNPLSPKSIKNIHGVFHRALEQAVKVGYLAANPSDACKLPRVVKKELQPLDTDQIAAFLKAIQGHPQEYLFKITLFTGLREGEVLGLTWGCIDFERSTLIVKQQVRREHFKGGKVYFSPPKNNKSRMLTLPASVVELFRLQKAQQDSMRQLAGKAWTENNLVFTNPLGDFLPARTVYNRFKRVVAEIGTPSTRFHDLRHTYAVSAIIGGDDIKTVQENLGHATAAFTLDVYCHVTGQMKRSSADRMEQFIQSVS